MARLAGKVAFVSGGGAGIGRATALRFAREGATVVVADIDVESARATESLVQAAGGHALALACDVREEDSVAAAFEAAGARFGALHVLFNCAGGSLPADSWITDVDMQVWDRTMHVDLKGTMHCCRHAIPRIVAAGGGAVVNMASGAALRGASPAHIYTAAKGAVVSLTRALAGAFARDNVRVNAICAGRIDTERIRRTYGTPHAAGSVPDRQDAAGQVERYPFWFGAPDDIASIALFLASDESRMITGAAIPADGGRSAY